MKSIFSILTIIVFTCLINTCEAQKTFNLVNNTSWSSAAYASYCNACTFRVLSGIVLTTDISNITCSNCAFTGGNISITKNFTCQSCSCTSERISMNNTTLNLQSSTTSFASVHCKILGNGSINATTSIAKSGSVFTFSNNSSFLNNGGSPTLTGSTMYFCNNSYFLANARPVNLKNTSSLEITSNHYA